MVVFRTSPKYHMRMDEYVADPLMERAPPGKKAERFIKKAKRDFKKRYGSEWKQALYATAWKLFG